MHANKLLPRSNCILAPCTGKVNISVGDLVVNIINDDKMSQWDDFVKRSPQGTFFHQSHWLNNIKSHMVDQEIRIYGCWRGDILVAGCTLRAIDNLGIRMAVKPWNTHYSGLIIGDFNEEITNRACIALIERLKYDYHGTTLVLAPDFQHIGLCESQGLRPHGRKTLIADISDVNTMWKHISSDARNQIRRAQRLGVKVVSSSDASILSRLYWQSYKRQNIDLHLRPTQIDSICHGVLATGRGILRVAVDSYGNPCNAVLIGCGNKVAYGLLSGSDSELCRNGAGSLLWWELFSELAENYSQVDMVGDGTPGIRRFKMQFNPRIVDIYEIAGFSSTWGKVLCTTLLNLKKINYMLRTMPKRINNITRRQVK